MRNRKRHKTIEDFSVSQLLDDFVSPDVQPSGKPAREIDDEDYIRMMLKKDALKELERTKRTSQSQKHGRESKPPRDTLDEGLRQRFFPEVSVRPVEKKLPPVEVQPLERVQPEDKIVEDILNTIVVKDVSGLATRMREAVDFLQDEMGTSESERRLVEALEEYHRPTESTKKRSDPLIYNDNILLLKRCQNCHFCVGEKNGNGSLWCLCTNPDRSTEVEIEDAWVKSRLNLPCWKAPQD
ncbi:hypothetical protein EU528_01215 [Candidatus Thorarchaeota archaeon]|nr:MAG: hypothetical protein EU528_01215 [Candidatus Thorarchaeota archaeon]